MSDEFRVDLETGRQYVWHGVTWATGKPTLLLANTATGLLDQIEVMGLELGLKVSNPAWFCTGRYGFADTFHVEPVPCRWQAEAGNGGQCPQCLEQDEFRFAHQFHKGGHAPPTLAAYMSQPHWLYVATFAHGASKVGTAAAPRRTSRLDEQGAMLATYLAEAPDGRVVRYLEDAISREIGVSQVVRGAGGDRNGRLRPKVLRSGPHNSTGTGRSIHMTCERVNTDSTSSPAPELRSWRGSPRAPRPYGTSSTSML